MLQTNQVQIGSDLIMSLSVGLYTNPLDVYRELIQNATDAYQEAGIASGEGIINIEIDRANRRISVQDRATGLTEQQMLKSLFSIGNSLKRGKQLRGFRGIGRLATLGYCKKLIFRSRNSAKSKVVEIIWDSLALHQRMMKPTEADISHILQEISDTSYPSLEEDTPERFFECIMEGVRPSANDILLNASAVGDYLSCVAPVPFSQDFTLRKEIYKILGKELVFEVNISINGEPFLTRPHRNDVIDPKKDSPISTILKVLPIERIASKTNGQANFIDTNLAQGWILNHDYPGALPPSANVRGLRIRVGNIQIGNERTLEHLFHETRFNSWCIGEIHITSPNIRPNTRRDSLEPSSTADDLENALKVLARHISDICRERSSQRNKKQKVNHTLTTIPKKKYRTLAKELDIKTPLPDKITISPKAS